MSDSAARPVGSTIRPDHGARVALITGAARADGPGEIGRALALAFARRGWQVALAVDHEAARPAAQALAAEVEALGRRAAVLVADLSSERGAAALVPACIAALGRPGCVVCHGDPAPADDATSAGYASLLASVARHVAAPVVLGRTLAEATPEAAREDETQRAVLIHLLDDALYHPAPERLSHALAQAALHRATAAQALALAPKVRVAALVRGRSPHADELAAAACYLADAPGVTGATLSVDGGEHLAPPAAGQA
ncbi:SDR family NAD(P)-dependent oxidoreductase [Burkholderia gladioli]|uniref:SDR family NAD(P)-dependent oxidoreductase n=1 Tax=Burkholderia gladioli TaxID=28095 RepID=UPI00163EC313|nr:SDR family NAD(P)-dependent oxidoreductase [Burkholderia gladioli]